MDAIPFHVSMISSTKTFIIFFRLSSPLHLFLSSFRAIRPANRHRSQKWRLLGNHPSDRPSATPPILQHARQCGSTRKRACNRLLFYFILKIRASSVAMRKIFDGSVFNAKRQLERFFCSENSTCGSRLQFSGKVVKKQKTNGEKKH